MDKTEALNKLTSAVTANTAATQTAVASIAAGEGVDPTAVSAAADQIAANTASLAGALSPAPAAPPAPDAGDSSAAGQ